MSFNSFITNILLLVSIACSSAVYAQENKTKYPGENDEDIFAGEIGIGYNQNTLTKWNNSIENDTLDIYSNLHFNVSQTVIPYAADTSLPMKGGILPVSYDSVTYDNQTRYELSVGKVGIDKKKSEWVWSLFFPNLDPRNELIEKRTLNSKTFAFENGGGLVCIGPFHYYNSHGVLEEIDLRFVPGTGNYFTQNLLNNFETHVRNSVEDGILVSYKNSSLGFGKNTFFQVGSTLHYISDNNTSSSFHSNLLRFQDNRGNFNLSYELTPYAVEHKLEFPAPPGFLTNSSTTDTILSISEKITLPQGAFLYDDYGLVVNNRQTKGDLFVVLDDDTLYTIIEARIWDDSFKGSTYDPDAPVIFDSISNNFLICSTRVEIVSGNDYRLIADVPLDWLNDSIRVYPVTFDPTIAVTSSSIATGYNYPFTTQYQQRISQLIVDKSLFPQNPIEITEIGFYVSQGNPYPNYNGRIQLKSTSLSSFGPSPYLEQYGWTTVKTGTFYFTSTGIESLNITDYYYDVSQNLMIETNFCQSSSGQYGIGGGFYYSTLSNNQHKWAYRSGTSCPSSTYPPYYSGQNPAFGPNFPVTFIVYDDNACSIGTPTNVTATPVSNSAIQIVWSSISGASYYRVFDCSGNAISGNISGTSYVHSGLQSGISYSYEVRAYASSTCFSGFSSCKSATTYTGCVPPDDPSLSGYFDTGSSQIRLNWSISPSGAYDYELYYPDCYSSSPSDFSTSNTAVNLQLQAGDIGLTYDFRMTACQSGSSTCCSGYSNCISVNTCPLSSGPTNLQGVVNYIDNTIELSWNSLAGANYYRIFNCSGDALSGYLSSTSATVGGISEGVSYCFQIRAYTNFSICESGYSNQVVVPVNCVPPSSVTPSVQPDPANPSTRVILTWQAIPGVSHYEIENCNGYIYGSTSSTTVTFTDASGFSNYCFRVKGCKNNACCSPLSSNANVITESLGSLPTRGNYSRDLRYPKGLASDPVSVATGEYLYAKELFRIPTISDDLIFRLNYFSKKDYKRSMGLRWSHNYDISVSVVPYTAGGLTFWTVHHSDGHESYYLADTTGVGIGTPWFGGTLDTLLRNVDSSFTLNTIDHETYQFDSTGRLQSITDRNGNITTLSYANYRLETVTAPGGRSLTFSYNPQGLIDSVFDPIGRYAYFEYDSFSNLTLIQDPKGYQTHFEYPLQTLVDDTGRVYNIIGIIDKIRDHVGNIIIDNEYDTTNLRVIRQYDAFGNETLFSYDLTNNITTVSIGGYQQQYYYDSRLRLTKYVDELNNNIEYSYNIDNRRLSVTDEESNTTSYEYNSRGEPTIEVNAIGDSTVFAYNPLGDLISVINPLNEVIGLVPDSYGNIEDINMPDSSTRAISYYSNGLPKTLSDGNGNTSTFAYSTQGDLKTITGPTGVSPQGTTSFFYNDIGLLDSISDPLNSTTMFYWDLNSNLVKVLLPNGDSITWAYDWNNLVVGTTNPKGYTTSYVRDAKTRITAIVNPKGDTIKLEYDLRDNIELYTDAEGNAYEFVYDDKSRIIKVLHPLGTLSYTYDNINHVESVTGNSNPITYAYDDLYRVTSALDQLGNSWSWQYDKAGRVETYTNPNGQAYNYEYTSTGHLKKAIAPDSAETLYERDDNGNLTKITRPDGSIITYTYDQLNRIKTESYGGLYTITYTYDAAGNLATEEHPDVTITYELDDNYRVEDIIHAPGDTYHFEHDANDNVTEYSNSTGGGTIDYNELDQPILVTDVYSRSITYGYDKNGNIDSIEYPGSKYVLYNYNGLNQITDVIISWTGDTISYAYDSIGRPTATLFPNGCKTEYGYDQAGRLKSVLHKYPNDSVFASNIFVLDSMGNRVADQGKANLTPTMPNSVLVFTYGDDDRLLMVVDTISKDTVNLSNTTNGSFASTISGSDSTSMTWTDYNKLSELIVDSTSLNYLYDAFGTRTSRTKNGVEQQFLTDINGPLSQILAEYSGTSNTPSTFYIYGLGLLAQIDSNSNTYYYHFDGQANTTAISNDTAALVNSYLYEPFGKLLASSEQVSNPFAFLGQYGIYQEVNDYSYIRARYYNSNWQRFLSKDEFNPVLISPTDINYYAYGLNNPFSYIDVTGFSPLEFTDPTDFSSDPYAFTEWFNNHMENILQEVRQKRIEINQNYRGIEKIKQRLNYFTQISLDIKKLNIKSGALKGVSQVTYYGEFGNLGAISLDGDDPGNYLFGAAAAEFGIKLPIANLGAGLNQFQTGIQNDDTKYFLRLLGRSTYSLPILPFRLDHPKDTKFINYGYFRKYQ